MNESTLSLHERLKLRLLQIWYRIDFAWPIRKCDECGRWFWKRESDEFHAVNLFYCSTGCAREAMAEMERDIDEIGGEFKWSPDWLTRN